MAMNFRYHIVRAEDDETWVSFVNVETKEAENLETNVLMVEVMQHETTITLEVYCETLKTLLTVIQNEGRGMLTYGVVLLHDNAHRHTAACTRACELGVV
jgi:diphthamide synthase (EF-2-diphthine--ammonia ligase)